LSQGRVRAAGAAAATRQAMTDPLSLEALKGPALVMVAWFTVYYALMVLQLTTRSAAIKRTQSRGEVFDRYQPKDHGAIMGDRTFLNAQEQSLPFVCALWSCSIFVSPSLATVLGSAAVASRVLFPILWSLGPDGKWSMLVELSTQPWYVCVYGMLGSVAVWAVSGVNLGEEHWAVVALACLGLYLGGFGLGALLGAALHGLTRGAYERGGDSDDDV